MENNTEKITEPAEQVLSVAEDATISEDVTTTPTEVGNPLKEMSIYKWIVLLVLGCFSFFILYGMAQAFFFELEIRHHPILGATLTALFSLITIWAYRGWQKRCEKQKTTDSRIIDLPLWTLKGFGVGVGIFVAIVAMMMVCGVYSVEKVTVDWTSLLSYLLLYIGVGIGEEVLFRGILFRMIDQRWNAIVGYIITALLFGFVHLPNDNGTVWAAIAISIEAGILLAAAYKYARNIWFPIGIHWAWNFTQGNIFGFSVSGNFSGTPLITPKLEGADLMTGGAFGAEASILAIIVGVACAAYFIKKVHTSCK